MRKLKQIMSNNVEVVRPEASLYDVAQKMRSFDVGALPVCDGHRIRGIITDRDLVVRGLAQGRDAKSLRASDLMSSEVFYCFEDDSVDDAAKIMQDKQVRRVIVVDSDKSLVGIVSLGDLATETRRKRFSGKTLQKVSEEAGIGATIVGLTPILFGAFAIALGYFVWSGYPELRERFDLREAA